MNVLYLRKCLWVRLSIDGGMKGRLKNKGGKIVGCFEGNMVRDGDV